MDKENVDVILDILVILSNFSIDHVVVLGTLLPNPAFIDSLFILLNLDPSSVTGMNEWHAIECRKYALCILSGFGTLLTRNFKFYLGSNPEASPCPFLKSGAWLPILMDYIDGPTDQYSEQALVNSSSHF